MRIRGLLIASALAAEAVLAACGTDSAETAAPSSSAPTSAPASASAPGPLIAPPSGPAGLHPDSGALPEAWPVEAVPEHGDEVWAVYLAIGPAGDPALVEAAAYLEDRGYATYSRELGCDGGAAEALGRDRDERAVAVYFDWRAEAGDFLTLTASRGKETAGPFVELLRVTTLECTA